MNDRTTASESPKAGATVTIARGIRAPDGLAESFWRYEDALMTNDLHTLDALFAPGTDTMRGDRLGLIVGHKAIGEFRSNRGGAPRRTVFGVHVRTIDNDNALVIAVFSPHSGGRGQQTQLWHRSVKGWQITAAHVSAPAPAVDPTVWRLVGTPLVAGDTGARAGAPAPLAGETVAVKDLFAVAGFAVGAGVPAYLLESRVSDVSSAAVCALLGAGADVVGIARTDEFAYSIAGRNLHYGTPPNPAVVGGLPGGSSSGPASAVALGHASIGLATDTAGSIRVPASYQGLWGLRTTHGAVSTEGLLPLAPSFDTVGWLTRDARPLATAAAASLAEAELVSDLGSFVALDTSLYGLEPDVEAAFAQTMDALRHAGISLATDAVGFGDSDALLTAFRAVQSFEAWATHGTWVREHPGALGREVAARFEAAATVSATDLERGRADITEARRRIATTLAGRILLLPSASSAAPSALADTATVERVRTATLRLTCLAGILRAPALSVPVMNVAAGPVGLCLIGRRFGDLALIEQGRRLADALS